MQTKMQEIFFFFVKLHLKILSFSFHRKKNILSSYCAHIWNLIFLYYEVIWSCATHEDRLFFFVSFGGCFIMVIYVPSWRCPWGITDFLLTESVLSRTNYCLMQYYATFFAVAFYLAFMGAFLFCFFFFFQSFINLLY